MKATLLVDALAPQPGGIGRYTWELCRGLRDRQDVDVAFVAQNRLIEDPAVLLRSTHLPRRKRIQRFFDRRNVRNVLRNSLVHGPNYFLPHDVERGVITVHDLSVFRFPETHPAERVRQFEERFAHSLERAAQIITDTETVRDEVMQTFGVNADRISAISLGVDPAFASRPAEVVNPQLAAWGLEAGCYALCVSTLEPRKKIAELLAAWEDLPAALRQRYPLVLAGGAGWRNEALIASVDRAVNAGWLKHLGFVAEERMPALYAGARLFIYPSIYEGFGLPPLEAMASGTPVITSNRSCLPEVCGDAARYIDPDDVASFRASLEEALTDEAGLDRFSELGLWRASEFTWSRCIEGTVAIYRKASQEGR